MTKLYRLKKDLPTFKAGDIFTLADNEDLYKDIGEQIPIHAYTASTLVKFPNILTDWFEEIPEPQKTVWDLKSGDDIWVIAEGIVFGGTWGYSDYEPERDAGDVFLHREEANKELARRKAKQVLLRDTKGFKPDWSEHNLKLEKWYVAWSIQGGFLEIDYTNFYRDNRIYFATKEDAEASIKIHEKEWKIYLGVEE